MTPNATKPPTPIHDAFISYASADIAIARRNDLKGAQKLIRSHGRWWIGLSVLVTSMALPLTQSSAQSAPESAQQLEAGAKKDYPNRSYTDSVRQEALKQAEAINKEAKTDEERIQSAVGHFFGFFLVNTRSHVAYCDHLGVDISPFTKAFVVANREMYEQSSKLLYRRGFTEDQLYKQWQTDLDAMTKKNFEDLATNEKLSTTQECQLQLQNLDARIARVTFSKILPDVSKTILEAQ